MARTKNEWMIRRKIEVTPYGHTNETVNRLMVNDDGTMDSIFVVQGAYGRCPIIADTEEEAVDRYVEKYLGRAALESEIEVTDEEE